LLAAKQVKINGLPKRLNEAVGALNAVLFTVRDIDLITGPPALRRRYLDITLSQVDSSYATARQRFDKVLEQRNHLLKRIRESLARVEELDFWDSELSRDAGHIFWARASALSALESQAAQAHDLLGAGETLSLRYKPRLGEEYLAALETADSAATAYLSALRGALSQQIAAGVTLLGPHRDDMEVTIDGISAAAFASRAQQRTLALSLRLAEAQYLRSLRGDTPVLLLDDIFSELDQRRRQRIMSALVGYDQILVTATEMDRFPPQFIEQASLYSVEAGQVQALDRSLTAER
ncbi:MAG TPA: DNA replication and repair protein RecF, partial [Dehalococcoidia bacterium]|nr:DNA replication and repair protein RecF [Dehalococcoidia bacterium]